MSSVINTKPKTVNPAEAAPLSLMNCTLRRTSQVIGSCKGSFTRPKANNIVTAAPNSLTLYTMLPGGKLSQISEQTFFTSGIRAIATIPCTDPHHVDYVAITLDSGYVQGLQYFPANTGGSGGSTAAVENISSTNLVDPLELAMKPRALGKWEVVASIMVGKSGTKRSVPGHYLAVDPTGRCLMVGALERHKVVVPIEQRFAQDLEANSSSGTRGVEVDEMERAHVDFKVGASQSTGTESAGIRKTKEEAQRITFGTPLEAHKSVVVQAMVPLDLGIEDINPTFACLEVSVSTDDDETTVEQQGGGGAAAGAGDGDVHSYVRPSLSKVVAYYSYDPGLKHVVRMWSTSVSAKANALVPLPGANSAGSHSCPSGVLVCGESEIQWVHNHVLPPTVAATNPPFPMGVMPARSGAFANRPTTPGASTGILVVGSGSIRFKDDFFLLLQDENGDLFRVKLDRPQGEDQNCHPHGWVVGIRYFDTVPVASGGLSVCMLRKKGYLTSFSESGDYLVHQVAGDGEQNDDYLMATDLIATGIQTYRKQPFFKPTPTKYLLPTDVVQHLGPLVSAQYVPTEPAVENLRPPNGGYLVAVSGRGPASQFSRLKYGKSVTTSGKPYTFPGGFSKLLAMTINGGSTNRLIVTAPQGGSMFYNTSDVDGVMGDQHATEMLIQNAPTLAATELGGGSGFIQVTPDVMRLIPGQGGDRKDWTHPLGKKITAAAVNNYQVVLGVKDAAMYFVVNPQDGMPARQGGEVQVHDAVNFVFPPVSRDTLAPFFGIVTRRSFEVNRFQDPSASAPFKPLESKGHLRLDASNLALEITSVAYFESGDGVTLSLLVGQNNGVFLRMRCDPKLGTLQSLSEFSTGPGQYPCHILPPCPGSGRAFVMGYNQMYVCRHEEGGQFVQDPVIHEGLAANTDVVEVLDQATKEYFLLGLQGDMFFVYQIPQSMSAGGAGSRYVLEAQKKLDVQAKRMSIVHLIQGTVGVLLGAEFRCAPYMMGKGDRVTGVPTVGQRPAVSTNSKPVMEHASVLQVVDLSGKGKIWPAVPLLAPDVALCLDYGVFPSMGHDPVVVVGTAKNYVATPLQHDGGAVMVYHFALSDNNGSHQTNGGSRPIMQMPLELAGDPNPIADDIPLSVHCFRGGVLVGHAGRTHGVQFFEWGSQSRKLLKKSKIAIFEGPIVSIVSRGDFVAVGDATGGVFFCKFEQRPGRGKDGLSLLADEAQPRRVVQLCFLDDATVAVSDKFGNISCLRLPPNCPTSRPYLFGEETFGMAALDLPKLCTVSTFYVGGLVNSLTSLRLKADVEPSRRGAGGVSTTNTPPADGLLYSTISGTIGTLLPFKTDAQFTHMHHFHNVLRRYMDPSTSLSGVSVVQPAENGGAAPGPTGKKSLPAQPALHRGVGLDHYAYRSKYSAGSTVIDGDLLDCFFRLTNEEQAAIEKEVKKELKKVNKQFEERGDQPRNFSDTCANRYMELKEAVAKL